MLSASEQIQVVLHRKPAVGFGRPLHHSRAGHSVRLMDDSNPWRQQAVGKYSLVKLRSANRTAMWRPSASLPLHGGRHTALRCVDSVSDTLRAYTNPREGLELASFGGALTGEGRLAALTCHPFCCPGARCTQHDGQLCSEQRWARVADASSLRERCQTTWFRPFAARAL